MYGWGILVNMNELGWKACGCAVWPCDYGLDKYSSKCPGGNLHILCEMICHNQRERADRALILFDIGTLGHAAHSQSSIKMSAFIAIGIRSGAYIEWVKHTQITLIWETSATQSNNLTKFIFPGISNTKWTWIRDLEHHHCSPNPSTIAPKLMTNTHPTNICESYLQKTI